MPVVTVTPAAASGTSSCRTVFNKLSAASLDDAAADTAKTDIFSAGCVLYNLLTGRAPGEDFRDASMAGRFPETLHPACRLRVGAPFWSTFEAMAQETAELRPSARELLSSSDHFGESVGI